MEKHTIVWRGVRIEITFTPDDFGMADHIELRAEGRAPLPVTEMGYRSHFMAKGTVAEQRLCQPLIQSRNCAPVSTVD